MKCGDVTQDGGECGRDCNGSVRQGTSLDDEHCDRMRLVGNTDMSER